MSPCFFVLLFFFLGAGGAVEDWRRTGRDSATGRREKRELVEKGEEGGEGPVRLHLLGLTSCHSSLGPTVGAEEAGAGGMIGVEEGEVEEGVEGRRRRGTGKTRVRWDGSLPEIILLKSCLAKYSLA